MRVDLSFIIVNYGGDEYVLKCIDSILRFSKNIEFEIIVIENSKNSSTKIRKISPKIIYKYNNQNLGFSKACNLGVKLANSNYYIFINPDIYFETPIDFNILIKNTTKNHNLAIQSYQLMKTNGQPILGVYRKLPNLFHQLICHSLFSFLFKRRSLFQSTKESYNCLTGAFMAISKTWFEKLEGFDERFFMYFEDVDMCKKVQSLKGEVSVMDQVKLVHIEGGTTVNEGKNFLTLRHFTRSQILYLLKWGKSTFIKPFLFIRVIDSFTKLLLQIPFSLITRRGASFIKRDWHVFLIYISSFFYKTSRLQERIESYNNYVSGETYDN